MSDIEFESDVVRLSREATTTPYKTGAAVRAPASAESAGRNWNRETVDTVLAPFFDEDDYDLHARAVDAIQALTPPGVPSWLGDVPKKPRIVHKDGEITVAGKYSLAPGASLEDARDRAWALLALVDAHEKERAENSEGGDA